MLVKSAFDISNGGRSGVGWHATHLIRWFANRRIAGLTLFLPGQASCYVID